MSRLGIYDHLNDEPLSVPITMERLVTLVMSQNYGVHRFLAELVRQREKERVARIEAYRLRGDDDIAAYCERREDEQARLTQAIRDALENGGY